MRYKIVPPVRDVAFLREVSDALPRVPNSVEDCCSRIRDRTDLSSRDRAREYLTFCEALGLAAESDGAYYRPPEPLAEGEGAEKRVKGELADAFVENVFGAREIHEALKSAGGESPLSAAAVFEAIEPIVPRWERNQEADWEATWRERTQRLLDWAVTFGLVERVDDGYRV